MRILLTIVIVIAVIVLTAGLLHRARRIPDTVEVVGPFEIVTHTHRYTYGYNEGQIRHGTTESYSLRYKGLPFVVAGKAGMFGDDTAHYETINSVITFPTPTPAFVVNVGDPNNTSFFYLVHEVSGTATAEYLGLTTGGNVSADMLDPAAVDASGQRGLAVHRRRLSGGRWLLLGQYTVLDAQTLVVRRFEQYPHAYLNPFKSPIALAPDQKSFVRLASGESPENAPLLVVFDFADSLSYALPVDRRVMRYNDWSEMDATWLDHYFEWRHDPSVADRLVQRENVRPLAYRGRLVVEPDSSYREYNLLPVKPEMKDTVIAFIERAFNGQRQPPPQYENGTTELKVGERMVNVLLHDDQVGIFMERGTDSRLVGEIGKGFDAELKDGKYDWMFTP